MGSVTVEHIGEFYGLLVTAWTFKGKRIDKCESKKYLNVDKTLTSCILGTLDNNKVGISNPKNSRVGGVKTQFTEKRERKQMKDVPNPWSSKRCQLQKFLQITLYVPDQETLKGWYCLVLLGT